MKLDKNLKKALIYLIISLITFLGGVITLDKINSSVEEDLTEYKTIIKQREEAAKQATPSN